MKYGGLVIALLAACDGATYGLVPGTAPDAGRGDGGGPVDDGCELVASSGPAGLLADYRIATNGTRWLLVHPRDSERTALWEHRGTGWTERFLDGGCRRGVMAVDAAGRANVACGVGSETLSDYDIRLFVVGPQTITSREVVHAVPEYSASRGGVPSSLALDPAGRATVLWQATYHGQVVVDSGDYYLSRDLGASWSSRRLLSYSFDGHTTNDRARIALLGGTLYFVYRDRYPALQIARVTSDGMDSIATFRTPTNLATGFAFDYELALARDGELRLAIADETNYADVEAPGLVFLRPDVLGDPELELAVDGVAPFGDGQAGLGGISMASDESDGPVLAYALATPPSLRLSRRAGAGWDRDDLAAGTQVGDTAIRYDSTGALHLAYEDRGDDRVHFFDEVCAP